MPLSNPLIWKGLLFSSTAVAFFLFLAWWLYLSPVRPPVQAAGQVSPRLAGWLAVLLSLAALQLITGAYWDASMHLKTGRIPGGSDFLWPPHIMIYSSFLFSFVVGLTAIGVVARVGWPAGMRDPRRWVRSHPYLGAVAVASLYMMMALPGDAIWHEVVGIDLTAWSPPHLMIALSNAAVLISGVALLARVRGRVARPGWANGAIVLLLALMLNVTYLVGILEWELPNGGAHLSRPIWFYPLVGGGLAFFALLLGRQLVDYRWTATAVAGGYYLVRLAVMAGLAATDNIVPALPPLFILGAVFMDLAAGQKQRPWLAPVAFTAGYALLAVPLLMNRDNLPGFDLVDGALGAFSLLLASLASLPVVGGLAGRLSAGQEITLTG
ncbi:MAG: hypothetical protein L0332_23345 [Chloroflexi bacterium]|nr:hypothetical protein [Chloroflexota bacterium]